MTDDAIPPPPPPAARPYSPRPYGYPAIAPPQRRSAWFYISVIGGSCAAIAAVFLFLFCVAMRSMENGGSLFSTKQIAVIDVDGVILSADRIVKQIHLYEDDSSVKAILLHINSPGGAAAPSQEIYSEILHLRQRKGHKPIIASVASVGASGAYYIASACDRIYANPSSVVGSIGVVMEWTNYGDLLRWAKLKSITISDGELKTAGDPTREMTPREQAYFQSLVDNMYGQFVHDVATGRQIDETKVKALATGQVWTGQEALPLGLIDKEGGFRVALLDTAKAVGISGEPAVVKAPNPSSGLLSLLTGGGDSLLQNPSNGLLSHSPGFYFLWR